MKANRTKRPGRTGLRLRGHRAPPEVRLAFVRFCRWLRTKYEFPVYVPVYLCPTKTILLRDKTARVSAAFFAPDDPDEDPMIRIAIGDFEMLREERGRDNALAAQLCSLAHELVHYRQWIETDEFTERGVIVRASNIVSAYAKDVDWP